MNKPNILVITQDANIQNEFKIILANDFEHSFAFNGIDGVAISRMTRPAIVFIDETLAQPDAVKVCKSLLSHEKVRSIPIVVLADNANVNGELNTLTNFGGVIQRTIQAQQVKSKIQWAIERKETPETPGGQKTAVKRDEPIRVLSVDDSSVVRKLVTMILTAEGFKVTTASDGVDGINKAKELKPDVILLDFVMPKMNGFQVCRILQKDENLRQIPVILVTSKGDKVGDKFVNQLGVIGYITKPFQPEELVSKIHQTLEAQGPAPEGIPAPGEAPAPAPSGDVPVAAPVVAPGSAVQQTATPSPDALKQLVQTEISQAIDQQIEQKVQEILKAELNKVIKNLDKLIEKRVIEKMNEYIRRAKKK